MPLSVSSHSVPPSIPPETTQTLTSHSALKKPSVAVTVVLPSFLPVTLPSGETDATVSSEMLQTTPPLLELGEVKATSSWVLPTPIRILSRLRTISLAKPTPFRENAASLSRITEE